LNSRALTKPFTSPNCPSPKTSSRRGRACAGVALTSGCAPVVVLEDCAQPGEAKQIEAADVTRIKLKRQVSVDIVTFHPCFSCTTLDEITDSA
jgi:hypothetical protein